LNIHKSSRILHIFIVHVELSNGMIFLENIYFMRSEFPSFLKILIQEQNSISKSLVVGVEMLIEKPKGYL